jgi:diamine N-acetyltransferase
MIKIERANLNHAYLLKDLGEKSFVESHGKSASKADIEFYVSKSYGLTKIRKELLDDKNIFHMIYCNDQPVGYSKIILNAQHQNINSDNSTKLERLYLLKEYYGLKFGLKLFEFIINLSKKNGQEGMWLFVWIKNDRALNFYRAAGFSIIGNTDFKISENHSNPNYQMYLRY